jgi:hypothetical protein
MFAAVGKAQTLIAETSASPKNTRPGSLPATGLYSLVLEAEILDRCLFACGERGIQYTERGAIEYACNYMYKIFSIVFQYIVRNFSTVLVISIFY